MRPEVIDDLEAFFEAGTLWDPDALEALVARLHHESEVTGDPIPARLARFLNAVLLRIQVDVISVRTRDDIEAIVYPRVWKLMEAAREGLPAGELHTRIEVMNRRLSRLFAAETSSSSAPADG